MLITLTINGLPPVIWNSNSARIGNSGAWFCYTAIRLRAELLGEICNGICEVLETRLPVLLSA